MAFSPKRRKNTWNIDHDNGDNVNSTNPYIFARKDSVKSVLPSSNNAQYVFYQLTASSFDRIGRTKKNYCCLLVPNENSCFST